MLLALKVPTQDKPLLIILLCKMANFQNDVISGILSVFLSRFSHRITVILSVFLVLSIKHILYVLTVIFCIIFDPQNSATR